MLFRSKNITPEAKFWNWFSKNSKKLRQLEGMEILDAVSTELYKYDESLCALIGYGEREIFELIISANGRASSVDSVERLCDSAPEIPGWKIIRFRPRFESGSHGIESEGVKIDTDGIQFVAYHDETKIGVEIYAHWRKPEDGDRTDALTFLMLDHTIGEYEVMCGIGFIEVHPLENAPENARPWNEFAEMFDKNWVREN
jgi:hypothetical protein